MMKRKITSWFPKVFVFRLRNFIKTIKMVSFDLDVKELYF